MHVSHYLLALDLHGLAHAICQTLLHSLWQGVVAAVLAGIVIAATTRSKPAVRYYLLLGICGFFVVASAATFWIHLTQAPDLPIVTASAVAAGGTAFPMPVQATGASAESRWEQLLHFIDANAAVLVIFWLVVFLFKSARLAAGLYGLQDRRRLATPVNNKWWVARVQGLANELHIDKAVTVLESALVKVPCTIGYFKPFILVPIGMFTMLPPDQVESILLHELAHVKRRDFAVNLLLECVAAVFFFNPAILWLLSIIRQEREVCCDAIVMEYKGHAQPYMEALVSFQEKYSQAAYVMPLTGKHSALFDRIKRMISQKNKNLTIMEKVFLSISMVAVVSFSFLSASPTKANGMAADQPLINAAPQWQAEAPLERAEPGSKAAIENDVVVATGSAANAVADTGGVNSTFLQDSITGVRQYTAATPNKRIDYTEITVASGNHYKIGKQKGVIVAFSLNGVAMDVKEAEKFAELITEVETKTALAEQQRHKAEQERKSLEKEGQKAEHAGRQMEQQSRDLETKLASTERAQEKIEQKQKEVAQRAAASENEHKRLEQEHAKAQQRSKQAEAEHKLHAEKRQHFYRNYDSVAAVQKQNVREIIAYLVKAGVVENAAAVQWFSLTNTTFSVNGKQLDAAIQQQLAKMYGVQSDIGLHYGSVPNTVKGYYFGKHEIKETR